MKIEEFLKSQVIEFPSDQTEKTYLDTIKTRFAQYRDAIISLEPSPIGDHIKLLSGKIDSLCISLEKSVDEYLKGNTHKSYEELKNGISIIDEEFRLWYSEPIKSSDLKKLFRIRVEDKILSDKKEMFHIPFQLRHLVKTQRYSIPGLPCLYFGASSYISWKEIGEPPLNNVYISRFETRDSIKILDFAKNHRAIEQMITKFVLEGHLVPLIKEKSLKITDKATKLVISWFAIFPLLVATSIRREHPGTDFCHAYVLSQHLMQFIRNDHSHHIDGIRYVSTKFRDEIKESFTIPHCWAFPVRTSQNAEHCPELKKLFKNTVIQSWQFSDQLIGGDIDNVTNANIEYMPGHSLPYDETIWGRSEAALLKLPATPIEDIEPLYPSIFHSIPNLVALQTTRSGGVSVAPQDSLNLAWHTGDDPAHVRENYRRLCANLGISPESIVTTGQVHGTEVALVNAPGNLDGYDALITNTRGLFVGIMTADCYPILVHDRRTGASGAAHAGWQGAAGRIAEKTVNAMRDAFGTRPEDCLAWVGTGISGECYEIGGEVAARFSSRYLVTSPSGEGKFLLDLSAANCDQLLEAGLPAEQVQCSEFCSYRDEVRFFSYRRDNGKTGRMLAMIGRK